MSVSKLNPTQKNVFSSNTALTKIKISIKIRFFSNFVETEGFFANGD